MSSHIDGKAGCGKSTLVNQLQAEMTKREFNFIALATTNKSARIINGKTIHKFMYQCNGRVSRTTNYDYIFIDEVSMMTERFYIFFIDFLKRLNPDIKFIISGDYQQLLPVNDRVGDCNYKNSSALHELRG